MNIRPACEHDADAIAALFVQLGYPLAGAGIEQRLARLLGDADTEVLVATVQDAVRAVLVMKVLQPLHVARPWAVISALVVDEAVRAQRAGAALVEAAEQAARKRGCAHVELNCSERRAGAHLFYEAMGFLEVRKRFLKKFAE